MHRLELDESFFGAEWEWTPLELTDSREKALKDFKSTTAEQEGWAKYKQDRAEYEAAMSTPENTPERRAAVEGFKRLMGRR